MKPWKSDLSAQLEKIWLDGSLPEPGLSEAVKKSIYDYGFALIRGLSNRQLDREQLGIKLTGLGSQFGQQVPQNANGVILDDVRDFSDSEAFDNRGYRSGGELTPHTDPPTLILLYCLNPAKSGGESQLVNIAAIHAEIESSRPDLLPSLYRAYQYWLPSETEPGVGHLSPWQRPILINNNGFVSCVYYRPFIDAAAKILAMPLAAVDVEAMDYFDQLAMSEEMQLRFTLNKDEAMILHNRAVMHARSDYEDWPDADKRRHLLRLWIDAPTLISVPEPHQLGDIFAE